MGLVDELGNNRRDDGSSHNCGFLSHEAKRHALHALVIDWFYLFLVGFMRLQGLVFSVEEGGQGGAVDIRVEYSHLESLVFECGCQVDCDCAFADAALAARHCDDFLDAEEVALAIEFLLLRFGGKHYLNIAETLSL